MTATAVATGKPATDKPGVIVGFVVVNGKIHETAPQPDEATAAAAAEALARKLGAEGVTPPHVRHAKSLSEARKVIKDALHPFPLVKHASDIQPTDDEVAAFVAARAERDSDAEKVARAAEKRLRTTAATGFYTVGTLDGETKASSKPVSDAATALALNSLKVDDGTKVAVHARSRDEAINNYEALAGSLPENRIVEKARRSGGGGGRKPRTFEAIDWSGEWTPVESTDGIYFITKSSGILHSSNTCRFVKPSMPSMKDETKTLITRLFASRKAGETDSLPVIDGTVGHGYCQICAARKVVAVADKAPAGAEAPAETDAEKNAADEAGAEATAK